MCRSTRLPPPRLDNANSLACVVLPPSSITPLPPNSLWWEQLDTGESSAPLPGRLCNLNLPRACRYNSPARWLKINGNCFRGIIINILLWMPFCHISPCRRSRFTPRLIYAAFDIPVGARLCREMRIISLIISNCLVTSAGLDFLA